MNVGMVSGTRKLFERFKEHLRGIVSYASGCIQASKTKAALLSHSMHHHRFCKWNNVLWNKHLSPFFSKVCQHCCGWCKPFHRDLAKHRKLSKNRGTDVWASLGLQRLPKASRGHSYRAEPYSDRQVKPGDLLHEDGIREIRKTKRCVTLSETCCSCNRDKQA